MIEGPLTKCLEGHPAANDGGGSTCKCIWIRSLVRPYKVVAFLMWSDVVGYIQLTLTSVSSLFFLKVSLVILIFMEGKLGGFQHKLFILLVILCVCLGLTMISSSPVLLDRLLLSSLSITSYYSESEFWRANMYMDGLGYSPPL